MNDPKLLLTALALTTLTLAQADPTEPPTPESLTTATQSQKATVDFKIASPKLGKNQIQLTLKDPNQNPIQDAQVTLKTRMTNMDMGVKESPTRFQNGKYTGEVEFSMAGPWEVDAQITLKDGTKLTKKLPVKVEKGMTMDHEMGDMEMMEGRLGDYSMQRDGSGTSWVPDSSPMFMKMLPKNGKYAQGLMGFATLNYNDAGGPRGDSRAFGNSMLMYMAQRKTGGGKLGFSVMASADPIFSGEYGYPNLFQTGETAYGNKLTDYQHPHDLLDEVSLTYSKPIARDTNAFVYLAPVGEPALGGPTFMHRPSGMEIPEAPISHHWFDSTHITWGVATLGVNNRQLQLEGSVFNGREPDENRYAPDNIRLNSASTRLTWNPTKNLSLNASYGFLKEPEASEPGVSIHRLTWAALYSLPLHGTDNLSLTAAFGRNIKQGDESDSFLAEATYLHKGTSFFGRWEHVEKDELQGVPAGNYLVNKFLVGAVHNLGSRSGFDYGIGAYAGFYTMPASLKPFYGNPTTFGVFFRVRPSRMMH